jgi:hypothetical protein
LNLVMTIANHGGMDLGAVKVWLITPSHVQWEENRDAVPLPDGFRISSVNPVEGEVWTLGTLGAGQSRTVVVAAQVAALGFAPEDGTLIPIATTAVAGNGASSAGSASLVVGTPSPVIWPTNIGGNGHSYQIVIIPNGVTWNQANAAAQAAGGYLATITSAPENSFVFRLIDRPLLWISSGNSRFGPWMGGSQAPGSPEPASGWAWVTGEQFTYSNWYPGEPNNFDGNQDKLYFLTQAPLERGETWGDQNASTSLAGYIIEYPQASLGMPRVHIDGSVEFDLIGQKWTPYRVQASTNLLEWRDIATVTPLAGPRVPFRDSESTNFMHRFYKLVTP